LSQIAALEIRCDDCGRANRMDADTLTRNGDCRVTDFKARLVCSTCKARGQAGRNIEAIPVLRRAK